MAIASTALPGTPASASAFRSASTSAFIWSAWLWVAWSGSSLVRCSGYSAVPDPIRPRALSTSEAAVTVKVTPRNLEGATWEFDVVFDTHTQELNDDLVKTAALVAADGSEIAPLEWKGAPPGGHHRAGVLRFKAPHPAPSVVLLKIARPAEAKPRVFQWKLK